MQNIVPTSIPGLIVAAGRTVAGLNQFGVQLGLTHNTSAAATAELTDLIMARNEHEQAKLALAARRETLSSLTESARQFATTARDVLKPFLGSQYSEGWDAAGFVGSLEVPRSSVDVQPLAVALGGYLTARPERENAPLNVTADRANGFYNDMTVARASIDAQQTVVTSLGNVRDEKAARVRTRLRKLINELTLALGDLDPRWQSFGLNMPGVQESPDTPEGVKVALIGPTAAAVKWPASARADYYRVWKKVLGVDPEPVAVGSPADLDFTLEALPANATIEIGVSAVNNGGGSGISTVVTVQTH